MQKWPLCSRIRGAPNGSKLLGLRMVTELQNSQQILLSKAENLPLSGPWGNVSRSIHHPRVDRSEFRVEDGYKQPWEQSEMTTSLSGGQGPRRSPKCPTNTPFRRTKSHPEGTAGLGSQVDQSGSSDSALLRATEVVTSPETPWRAPSYKIL